MLDSELLREQVEVTARRPSLATTRIGNVIQTARRGLSKQSEIMKLAPILSHDSA